MAGLKPINLARERGCWFGIAFIYTPNGVKMLTGDWGAINGYCREHFGICHGVILAPNELNRLFNKYQPELTRTCPDYDKEVRLFGTEWEQRIDLMWISKPRDMHKYGLKRPCFALIKDRWSFGKDAKVIRTWRRLPKKNINFEKLIKENK